MHGLLNAYFHVAWRVTYCLLEVKFALMQHVYSGTKSPLWFLFGTDLLVRSRANGGLRRERCHACRMFEDERYRSDPVGLWQLAQCCIFNF